MDSLSEIALENIFGELVGVLTGSAKTIIDKRLIRAEFLKCGEMLRKFENSGSDSFGEAIQKVFSKENLLEIYNKIKDEPGYDIDSNIRQKLENISSEYDGIDAETFIEAFIGMFRKCVYKYDRDLYDEMCQGRWYEEDHARYLMLAEKQSQIISKVNNIECILQEKWPSRQREQFPLLNADSTTADIRENTEDPLLEWELHYPHRKKIYLDETEGKNRLIELTCQWKEERQKAPSWYILPRNKRRILDLYTFDDELLYSVKEASPLEMFDFAYELVWRYEAAFVSYTAEVQKEVRKIWESTNQNSMDEERRQHWFFIGQALLRDYREKMESDEWDGIYKKLWEVRNTVANGEDGLTLERIKFLFMKMKISETREKLLTIRWGKQAWGIRLQAAGIKAECGLQQESFQDLQELEKDILCILGEDTEKKNHILYKSVLSCVYYLQSFVWQALRPFEQERKELQEIWGKRRSLEQYFNFDQEKQSFVLQLYQNLKKEKEAGAFEIDREKKTIICNAERFIEVYDFFRVLDRISIPLHLGCTRLMDDDESDFIRILLEKYEYIGWYMLLRFGTIKTTEKVLGRRECIILIRNNREGLKKAFEYIYLAVNEDITKLQMADETHYGDAYSHILLNGIEILRRLASVVNLNGQKKLIDLMCRLIDVDVMEHQDLDKWTRQIMSVTEERVKAAMLNELLNCSAKEGIHGGGRNFADPFDFLCTFTEAERLYQSAEIDPDIVDNMISRAGKNEKEKKHIMPRLGQMAEWNLLTDEQRERVGELLWEDISGEKLFPYEGYYFCDTFLRWPYPKNINVEERIKRKLLDINNFEVIKKQGLSSFTFEDNVFLREIQHLNRNTEMFWKTDEIELLMKGILDCWKEMQRNFQESRHRELYEDEFLSLTKMVIHTISSFGRSQMRKIDTSVIERINEMAGELREFGLETIELFVLLAPPEDLDQVEKRIINGLRSADREMTIASVNAADKLFRDCSQVSCVENIFKELILLCLYRKEPGLEHCLVTVHNYLYLGNMEVSEDILNMLYETLDAIDKQTDYEKNIEKSDKEIKYLIKIRKACAGLAYQLYQYEERKKISHSDTVLKWKDICRGRRSSKEYSEVKRHWVV